MKARSERLLRIAFLAGAVTDGLALLPMLSPHLATLMWGLHDPSDSYRVAMRSGASLMLGWTMLLLWAYRRPLERRAVAAFTIVVVAGLVAAELSGVKAGVLEAGRVVPMFVLQIVLAGLFVAALYFGRARDPQPLFAKSIGADERGGAR